MAAHDDNSSRLVVGVLHDTDLAARQVAAGSRTSGVAYEGKSLLFYGQEVRGKKLHEYSNAGAEAGTTTTTSSLTSVHSALFRNVGSYDVEVEWWEIIGAAAAGNIVITKNAAANDTIGHASTDMDASPQYADAGDWVHLSSAAEDAGNQNTYWLIESVAAAAGTTQITLAKVNSITGNADDDSAVLTFLRKNKVVLPANGGVAVGRALWVAKNIVCTGRGGASEVKIALLEV